MSSEITHANPLCPLWKLDVPEGVELYVSNIGPVLSVGVVNTNVSVAEQLAKLLEIQKTVRETCSMCAHHINGGGSCKPGGVFMGGIFCDLVVAQRDQFPEEMKSNPYFYYSDF